MKDIKDRIQAMLLGEITELLMKSGVQSVPDANKLLGDLEGAMLAKVNEKFQALGLRIKAFEANPFRAKEDVSLDEIRNYVSLDPQRSPAHVMELRSRLRRENDFDYFL